MQINKETIEQLFRQHYLRMYQLARVLLNIDADATRRHRILPDSQERTPHPGVYDPLLDDQEQRHHHDHEDKKPEVVVQFKAENADIRDPADTIADMRMHNS